MGKKAKLKKMRRELKMNPQQQESLPSTQFVKHLNKLGYQLEQIERSPDVPTEKIEPQL